MPDQRYVIGISFQVEDLQSKLSGITSRVPSNMFAGSQAGADSLLGRFRGISSAASEIGGRLSDAFTGAVEKAADIAMTLGKLGAVAGIGAAVYGVASLNSELEKTQIALADIFTANGVTANLTDGMGMASGMMAQIRKDAAALPGETSDLAQIFKMAAIPGIQAGADPKALEKLSANAMAFGMGVANLDGATVARELSMLISGRAGSHNVLGLQLAALGGDKAKEFNHMSSSQRLAVLTKEFEKHAGSIKLFSASFEGLSSTLKDNAKLFLASATKPLFDHVKGTLGAMNGWFEGDGKGHIGTFAGMLGDRLAEAWDTGVNAIERWWPAIRTFALAAYEEIAGIWKNIEPTVARIGASIRESLGDGSAIDRIENVLKLYAAMKVGTPMMGAFSSGASMLGGGGGVGLAAGALGSAAALIALAAAAGEAKALYDQSSENHKAAVDAASSLASSFDGLVAQLNISVSPALERFGIGATNYAATLVRSLTPNTAAQDDQEEYASYLATMSKLQRGGGRGDLIAAEDARHLQYIKDHPHLNDTEGVSIDRNMDLGAGTFVKRMGESIAEAQHKVTPKLHGGGGTNIAHLQINVNGNDSPSRVARIVMQKIAETSRYPTSSRNATNWTAGRT